ncbi:MAG TPA: tail fiber domain-containing protein [Candidatus Paceibacterota bacterium]
MKKIIFALAILSIASVASAQTWSNPGSTPTGGNAATPINVSSATQDKSGNLSVGAFIATLNSQFTQKLGVGMAPSYNLDVNGTVGATTYFYTSDKKLKANIKPLTGSLANITKLQGVSFDWKKDGTSSIGLVAQDVEEVYPTLVSENDKGIKSVQYANLVAPLIEAIKEQQKQIEDLKAEVAELKAR